MVGAPIEADWKISKVLELYPNLLDVLVSAHPAFQRLRNPLMRRLQSRLVSVRQAAGIAGIDVNQLLHTLNEAAGNESIDVFPSAVPVPAEQPQPKWIDSVQIAEKLDVRPLIARGKEPYSMIAGAARRIPIGKALSLRSPFDPVPLRDALAKQGFEAYSTGNGDDWTTLFLRVRETIPARPAKREVAPQNDVTAEVTIDVSELIPPQPMMKILAALDELPVGGQLIVHHVRRPMHLYPRLDEMGYSHSTTELRDNKVEILIRKSAAVT